MNTTAENKNTIKDLDFEVSRDIAPRWWGWYYLKPMNDKARAFLLEDFDPEYDYWDNKERDALRLEQRDMNELTENIEHCGFTGNWECLNNDDDLSKL